jgi:hypothetical protein
MQACMKLTLDVGLTNCSICSCQDPMRVLRKPTHDLQVLIVPLAHPQDHTLGRNKLERVGALPFFRMHSGNNSKSHIEALHCSVLTDSAESNPALQEQQVRFEKQFIEFQNK